MKILLTTLIILIALVVSPVFGEEEKEKSKIELLLEELEKGIPKDIPEVTKSERNKWF